MKPFKKTVYLAGAISYFYNTNQRERATGWRDIAEKYLEFYEIKCFNPCKESQHAWEQPQNGTMKQNYFYLKNSDIILVNLDMINDSIGTVWELSVGWMEHKPIIAFGKTNWLERPHTQSLIDVKVDTLEEALEYISEMYVL
jgi:nucleoside 2-deoxyribosyltransferase